MEDGAPPHRCLAGAGGSPRHVGGTRRELWRAGAATVRPSTTPYLALLHAEGFHQRRRDIGVVVHHLPSPAFTPVDVRHPPIDAHQLLSDLRLATFGAHGVCVIVTYGNHYLLIHPPLMIRDSPLRDRLCGLLPAGSHFFPSE